MYEITSREDFTPEIHLLKVKSPEVARKARAGQFVVIMVDETGERIPLTIADWDEGGLSLVFMEVGKTTRQLATLKAGDSLAALAGPLGMPTHIEDYGAVVCVAGGVGVAAVYPIARALKEAGNNVISIMGFRNKGLVFWEEQLRNVSDELTVTTDDGSYGRKGLVTEPLRELLEVNKDIKRVIAIGPTVMMKFVSKATEPFGVKTIASINSIMVDGTGMCGGCRVEVGGEARFACVDGPDFDGHQVNWDLLLARQRSYVEQEKESLRTWECRCR